MPFDWKFSGFGWQTSCSLDYGKKGGQAFDLGVTNILQGSKKLGAVEQPTRLPSSA